MSTFPTAAEARAGSRNNLAIHDEIRHIEGKIYEAITAGVLSLEVTDSPMTDVSSPNYDKEGVVDPLDYYTALFSDNGDRSLIEQVLFVQKNFVDLGYQMTPLKNLSGGRSFFWRIMW